MKIVLFGDSIRQQASGYGKIVQETLEKEGHKVWQPDDNSRFSKYLLRQIADYKNEIKDANVIHFNAGHWDIGVMFDSDCESFSTIDEYLNNLRRIVAEFKTITPRIIFATTTPVRSKHVNENNELIQKYNAAAVKLMKELDVKIDDLFPIVLPELENCILGEKDQIHPTEYGKKILAKQVLKVIREEMKHIK